MEPWQAVTSPWKGSVLCSAKYVSPFGLMPISLRSAYLYIWANIQAEMKYAYKELHFHIFNITYTHFYGSFRFLYKNLNGGKIHNSLSSLFSVALDFGAPLSHSWISRPLSCPSVTLSYSSSDLSVFKRIRYLASLWDAYPNSDKAISRVAKYWKNHMQYCCYIPFSISYYHFITASMIWFLKS